MRSIFRLPSALAIVLLWTVPAFAAPKSKPASSPASDPDAPKKSGKEISTDDRALDKQMDWEARVLGPNTVKKIDHAKIQKLQAEELARREKQEKIDQVEKDRKEREAAAEAAAQRNVKAPSTREVPAVVETAPPAKPVEKHDDAFVDKLLTGKGEKKKVAVSNDEVDQLLSKAKQEKAPSGTGKGRGKGIDNVDQLLATADKQAPIKMSQRGPEVPDTVSAEAAAREGTLKAVAAAAAAKAQEDRARKRNAIPDAAVLRAQAMAAAPPADGAQTKARGKGKEMTAAEPSRSAAPGASRAAWTDPFASDGPSIATSKARHSKGAAAAAPPAPPSSRLRPAAAAGRHPPASTRPAAPAGNDAWQDPFDSGGSVKPRPAPAKAAPAVRPGKHPPNWKDPFALVGEANCLMHRRG